MTRRTVLLLAAAETLENGRDPLHEPFLSSRGVTLDECLNLAKQLAIGARIVAYGLDHPRSPEGAAVLISIAREQS